MLQQRAVRVADGKLLATASLTLASVDSTGKLIALPQPVRDALCQKLEGMWVIGGALLRSATGGGLRRDGEGRAFLRKVT